MIDLLMAARSDSSRLWTDCRYIFVVGMNNPQPTTDSDTQRNAAFAAGMQRFGPRSFVRSFVHAPKRRVRINDLQFMAIVLCANVSWEPCSQ